MTDSSSSETDDRNEKNLLHTYLKMVCFVGLIGLVVLVRSILLLTFISILLATFLSFPVDLFSKKVYRGFALLLTLVLLTLGVGSLGFFIVPQLSEQAQTISNRLPKAIDDIKGWFKKIEKSETVSELHPEGKISDKLTHQAGGLLESAFKEVFPAAKGIVEFISTIVFVLVLAIFFIAGPESYQNGMRTLVPRQHEMEFDEACKRLGQGLRQWVGGILIAMTLMGIFTGIGLMIAGIDDWFLLAVLTFVGTFVPYLGAIASAIPGLLIALTQSPTHFGYACLVYLGVHILEGYVVEPLIMKRAVEIKPAVLLLGQSIFLTLFGVLGIIVAAPLIACLQTLIQYLYVERKLKKG